MAMAAASSPALSNNATDATVTSSSAIPPTTNASRNLRGLNKPKCIKCGNVARSRCPYQSCKSCCSKAQNPCHIHVLKSNSTIPDNMPSSGNHSFEQPSAAASTSGNSLRVASLRQLSNNFAQFNNLQSPLRSRKPLTRKDAALINEWRFSKLKECRDRNIEAENEAFNRYMQNVNLLEEVFSVNSTMDGHSEDGNTAESGPSLDDNAEMMIGGLKLKFRPNPIRTESFRRRMQYIINQGLKKLQKFESSDGVSHQIEPDEVVRKQKKQKSLGSERASAMNDLIDRLSKARNEEDLRSCLELKTQLFDKSVEMNQVDSEDNKTSEQQNANNHSAPVQVDSKDSKDNKTSEEQNAHNHSAPVEHIYSPPKWFSITTTDQESLSQIDAHFSSLGEIEDL